VLQATWTAYQLPGAISGAAAVARQGRLLLAGGGIGTSAPANSVVALNPATGREHSVARLAVPVADAAAAVVRGTLTVFGGTAGLPTARVQALGPGGAARVTARLPGARSGLTAVTASGTTYLIGGTDGARRPPAVLATADGTHFSVAARLPVPVAFAGAVAYRGKLWVFGGMTAAGPTSVIQVVDPSTGRARVAGRLPRPLAAESAFVLSGRIFLAGGLTSTRPPRASGAILQVDPSAAAVATAAGTLPLPAAHSAVAVAGGTAYLVGGTDGAHAIPAVVALRLVPPADAVPADPAAAAAARPSTMPWLGPARGRGHLAPGSDPAALPAPVLVADHQNNRLVVIDPRGRVRWVFPRPGDLAPGQKFVAPDDAFFSPDGRYIIATQEDDQVISVIDVAARKIVFRYGKPGIAGMGPNRLDNPDDALLTPSGDIVAADIKNCRLIAVAPPAHRPLRVIGQTTNYCAHDPPRHFASPNGAFPASNGSYVVTEINGDWADSMDLTGHLRWSVHPPGVFYPSDTNEILPGRYLTADYSNPGQIVEFSRRGRLIWRFGGLNQPSLALPIPNGDILVNDDFNHRIIVIDPKTNRIVWQYGHTGVAGRAPGYLNDPDGLDLVPPDSFLIRHATTMGQP
jgi:hypothetical protein